MLRSVVASISQKSGVKLEVSGAMPEVGLFVESKDLTLKEIMDAVAESVYGEWEPQKDGWILKRSREKTRKAEEAYVAEAAAYIKKQLDSAKEHWLAPSPTTADITQFKAEWARLRTTEGKAGEDMLLRLEHRSPALALLGRLLLAESPERLARLSQSRQILAINPTTAQNRLSHKSVLAEVERAQKDERMFREANVPTFYRLAGGASSPVTEVHIQLERNDGAYRSFVAHMRLFGSNGELQGRGFLVFQTYSGSDWSELTKGLPQTFEPTPQQLTFSDTLVGTLTEPAITYMKSDSPEVLGLVCTPALQEWSKSKGGSMVCVVPDAVIYSACTPTGRSKRANPIFLVNTLASQLNANALTQVGRVPILRPSRASLLDTMNMPRPAIASLYKSVLSATPEKGNELLRGYEASYPAEYVVDFRWEAQLAGRHLNPKGWSEQMEAMDRIYWSLTAGQRRELSQGRGLPIGALGERPLKVINELVMQGEYLTQKGGPEVPRPWGPEPMTPRHEVTHLREEPTWSFPKGVRIGVLVAERETVASLVLQDAPTNPKQVYGPVSAEFASGGPTLKYYLPVEESRLKLTLQFDQDLHMQGSVRLGWKPTQREAVLRENLPKAVRDALDAADKMRGDSVPTAAGGRAAKP